MELFSVSWNKTESGLLTEKYTAGTAYVVAEALSAALGKFEEKLGTGVRVTSVSQMTGKNAYGLGASTSSYTYDVIT